MKNSKTDQLLQEVTDRVIKDLKNGTSPWEKPWFVAIATNASTEKLYNGFNRIALAISKELNQFSSNVWVTYKQAQALKGTIKRGSRGSKITYYDHREKETINKAGEIEVNVSFFLKEWTVFNLNQTEGLEGLVEKFKHKTSTFERIEFAETILKASGAHYDEKESHRAFYSPVLDFIVLPKIELFKKQEGYYGTVFHELIHWSGAKSRLDRDFSGRFGDQAYAFEELVAEIGAALLCSHVGLAYNNQHSSYIASWIQVLQKDHKALMTAASKAQKAVDYILALYEQNAQKVA